MLRHVILPLMTQSRLSLRLKTNHGGLIADMNQQLKCGNATLFWLPVVAPLNPARRAGERGFFRSRSGRFGDSPSRSTDGSLWDSVREFCLEAMLGDSQLTAGESSAEDGEKRTIADRYAKGETMADLAAEYEVGLGTIHRALNSPFEAGASV